MAPLGLILVGLGLRPHPLPGVENDPFILVLSGFAAAAPRCRWAREPRVRIRNVI